jgi:hypothetical protein
LDDNSYTVPTRTLLVKRQWLLIALANFFIAAILGVLMRYAFVEELLWIDYKNVQHAHSHVAILGWVYQALFALLIHCFVPAEKQASKFYQNLFWLTQISVIGMLVSFPIQGYGLVAISFSTMQILCSYVFAYRLYLDLGQHKSYSGKLAKTALVFLVLSTAGVWAVGGLMSLDLKGSALYYMAVQFYLHFQFNGWFLFAILALVFKFLEDFFPPLSKRRLKVLYVLLTISSVLTYALAVAWSQPLLMIFFINSAGVIIQLAALICLLTIIWKIRVALLSCFSPAAIWLLRLAFLSFVAKVVIQTCVALPWMAEVGYTIRNFVIGFIHLILIGFVTSAVIAYALRQQLLSAARPLSRLGIRLIILGFVGSEFILFLQGALLWGAYGFLANYYEMLFLISLALPMGILVLLIDQRGVWRPFA